MLQRWRNVMLNQKAMDKENMPPIHESQTRRKPSQLNWIHITRKGMRIDETLEATTNDVERGTCFLRSTTKSWTFLWIHFLRSPKQKNKVYKNGTKSVFTKKKCFNDQMDLRYAKMWNMQHCKANTNKAYTILKWNIRQ